MADRALIASGSGSTPLSYRVPGATSIRIKQVHVQYVDNGAGGDWLPAIQIVSDSDHLMGTAADQAVKVTAGSDADVSFFPYGRRRVALSRLTLDYNLGEIGSNIETTRQSQVTVFTTYQNVGKGDGILILLAAPSKPSALGTVGHPFGINDDPGNVYTTLGSFAFEASPPNVNEGVYATLFWCPASVAEMVVGVDRFICLWDNAIFDATATVWTVRHSGGARTPTVLAATADNDAAVFASSDVTLAAPNFTPARNQGLEFAIIVTAKSTGMGGFSSIVGWTGFFQAEFRRFTGSKQEYLRNPQTHGADAYLIAGAVPAPFEDDVGLLPGGVLVPAFNGVAQHYTTGTNAWKGIILLGLD